MMRSFLIYTFHHLIIKVLESRRMKRAGHAARMEETGRKYNILIGNPEG
jgi:hypothetical protein